MHQCNRINTFISLLSVCLFTLRLGTCTLIRNMDYDDIDYDEGYSIRDIDNNWLNSSMDYKGTDSDSDSDIGDYNYNNNTNNWSTLT